MSICVKLLCVQLVIMLANIVYALRPSFLGSFKQNVQDALSAINVAGFVAWMICLVIEAVNP